MSIKHDHTLNPVTALEFYSTPSGQLLLAGEGCYLKIFDTSTSSLLYQYRVFEDQAIHGVTSRHNDDPGDDDSALEVVVWGGSSLIIFTRNDFSELLASGASPNGVNYSEYLSDSALRQSSSNVSDWVLDAVIAPDGKECVLVTAHNTVLRAKLGKDSHEIFLETLHSPTRSILYSAQLIWESANSVLIAAGTVFGEIIVWHCSILESSILPASRVLHTFNGHEGSVFGVSISSIVADRNGGATRLLASCSDDRTIRIWELDLDRRDISQLSEVTVTEETGFGENGDQGEISSKCLAMAMGHASRIWGVEFLIRNADVSVLSFGEDATTQHWALEDSGYSDLRAKTDDILGQSKQARLMHLNTYAFHSGKQIWSRAIYELKVSIVATGGADGKIAMYESTRSDTGTRVMSTQSLQNGDIGITQDATHSLSWDLEEFLKDILKDLPSAGNISVEPTNRPPSEPQTQDANTSSRISNHSSLSDERNGSKSPKKTKSRKVPKDSFNKYAFVAENQVIVTTTFGRVLLGEIGACVQWTEVSMAGLNDLKSHSIVRGVPAVGIAFIGSASGKILFYRAGIIGEFGKVSGKVADMFAIYDGDDGDVELFVTTLGATFATLFKLASNNTGLREECRKLKEVQYQLPERFIVTSAGKSGTGLLILGSRNGGLAIYDPERCNGPISNWVPDVRSGDAVTSIVSLPNSINDTKHYFVTTGRDGTYSIFSLHGSTAQLVHQGTPPFGPMIEAAWFSGSDLILYGFKSKNFIVWNETKQYEVSSVECGGAHRSYAYSPIGGGDGAGHFVYTKASKLYLQSQRQPSHRIIKPGGHGREIKASAVSLDGLIATGAEDTVIRIWKYQDGQSATKKQFECLAIVEKHTTGIQHLQWHGSHYLFSSGGNEEFFVWAVEAIPGFGIGVVREASCPDQSEEKDLRIMSFGVSSLPGSGNAFETFLISLAYSDSTIRCYTYAKEQGFGLVAIGRYTSSCLMQLRHLKISRDELFMLTTATDGCLSVWKTAISTGDNSQTSKPVMLSNHRVQQSSVKALDISLKEGKIVVATGGDDNALGITIYQAENLMKKPRSLIIRSAHAAAITGLSFVGSGEESRIVTSSNDQRVKEWSLSSKTSDELEDWSLKKTGDVFTSVADIGDVTALMSGSEEARKVLVVGNGMEVYQMCL